jgi:surface antigen
MIRTAARCLLLALVCTSGGVATSWAGQGPPPNIHAGSPHGVSLVASTDQVAAGGRAAITVRAPLHASCALSFTRSHQPRSRTYRVRMRKRFATWAWAVPATVRGGPWLARVSCRSRGRTSQVRTRVIVSRVGAGKATIARGHAVKVTLTRKAPKVGGAGKGAASYPNGDAVCVSTHVRNGYCPGYNWGYAPGYATSSARGFDYRNCTDYAAWFEGLTAANFHFPAGKGNAKDWATYVPDGFTKSTTPSVGDMAVWTTGEYGHVAIVVAVNADNSVSTNDYNGDARGNPTALYSQHASVYLHRIPVKAEPKPGDYLGHIVQWNGDTKAQKTSWLVGTDGQRRWIPTIAMYNCLKDQGAPGPDVLPGSMLDLLPDLFGTQATCAGNGKGDGTSQPPPPTRVIPYNNYAEGGAGHAMCRGNPGNAASMPGGTASQTFVVPTGVASLDSAVVQIDPDTTVTAQASLAVNGTPKASASAAAAGNTTFTFPSSVPVAAGDTVTLSIAFTATSGKIITVYTVGAPGGTFTANNSCPDGAASITDGGTGLRATVSGWSP